MKKILSIGYFEIQSSDRQREIAFYGNVFGWKFVREENAPIDYYRIETGGIGGGLLERPAGVPMPECRTNAFTCSVQVESFDETAELIINNGGRIAMPKFPVPGRCSQGYFPDPDNNVFGILKLTAKRNETC